MPLLRQEAWQMHQLINCLRNYIVHNTNMITALRLPDTLFMQTGGIEVGCDFFIFQKHSHKAMLTSKEQLFLQVARRGCT